jgi:hypothetical protein
MSSEKKIAANRRNAQRSTGPNDTATTRLNAVSHGLLAKGITPLDDPERYEATLAELRRDKKPLGPIENLLVQCIALDVIKWPRSQRHEAEYIAGALYPPQYEENSATDLSDIFPASELLDPGLPATLNLKVIEDVVHTFQRYETQISNRIFRNLHELERMQRARKGENVPAPVTMDVAVHATVETSNLAGQQHNRAVPSNVGIPPTPPSSPHGTQVVSQFVSVGAEELPNSLHSPAERDESDTSPAGCSTTRTKAEGTEQLQNPVWQKIPPISIWMRETKQSQT